MPCDSLFDEIWRKGDKKWEQKERGERGRMRKIERGEKCEEKKRGERGKERKMKRF